MANNVQEYVLTKDGVATLARAILDQVNAKIQNRIVTELNDESDDKHLPSAKTVHEAITSVDSVMALVISDGDITKAHITPDEKTLYVVRKSPSAAEGTPWIYLKPFGFVKAIPSGEGGGGGVDFDIVPMPDDLIIDVVDQAAADTDPDTSYGVLTVQYISQDPDFVAPAAYSKSIIVGGSYTVNSPAVEGYTADVLVVSGVMVEGGVEVVVTYTKD